MPFIHPCRHSGKSFECDNLKDQVIGMMMLPTNLKKLLASHQKWVLLLAFVFLQLSMISPAEDFHKVPALPGDGVYSLLRRYQLAGHSCNLEQFYKLNQLKASEGLRVGKYYYVPILIYTFNGKTIRSSIGIDNWDLAINIQSFNEQMLKDGYRESSFKSDKVLWVPYHMLHCPTADVPEEIAAPNPPDEGETNLSNQGGGSRVFPIFGKKYQHVPLKSNQLRGKVYYIVTGHGGPDPGAMGKQAGFTLCEDEYAYDVGLRLCRNLIEHGATAYMIIRDQNDGIRDEKYLSCDSDEVVWGDQKIFRQQKPRLFQRSNAINNLYEKHQKQGVADQKAIMIHVDSRSKSQQTDLFFYYAPGSTTSKAFANQLHQTMKAKYAQYRKSGSYHGTVTPRDLHMLRETKPTSVYIELGNIRNSFDQLRIVPESNRQALANWLSEGIRK